MIRLVSTLYIPHLGCGLFYEHQKEKTNSKIWLEASIQSEENLPTEDYLNKLMGER